MSHDQRLEYLATTKDEGNKRSVSFLWRVSCGNLELNLMVVDNIGLTSVLRTKSKRRSRNLLGRDVWVVVRWSCSRRYDLDRQMMVTRIFVWMHIHTRGVNSFHAKTLLAGMGPFPLRQTISEAH